MKNSLSTLNTKIKEFLAMPFKVRSEEIKQVKYGFGDVFRNHETDESVVVAFLKKSDNKKIVSLVSEDCLFEEEPIRYELTEEQLLNNFYLFDSSRLNIKPNTNYRASF